MLSIILAHDDVVDVGVTSGARAGMAGACIGAGALLCERIVIGAGAVMTVITKLVAHIEIQHGSPGIRAVAQSCMETVR